MDIIILIWLAVLIALTIIPASIAKNKGYDPGVWYIYSFFLFPIALIHSMCLKDKSEQIEKEEKEKEEQLKIKKEKLTGSHRLLNLIDLYEKGVLSKIEFIDEKGKMWAKVDKALKDSSDLYRVKKVYEQGLFTEQEYSKIKEATLNPETQIKTWYVEFDGSIIPGVKIKALETASNEEIEQLVREQKYTSKIKKIYQLNDE